MTTTNSDSSSSPRRYRASRGEPKPGKVRGCVSKAEAFRRAGSPIPGSLLDQCLQEIARKEAAAAAPEVPFVPRAIACELEVHRFVVDASEIGLAPGAAAPRTLRTDLGNGQPFVLQRIDDVGGLHYLQSLGCVSLVVAND